jgi:hypothetical protein
MPATTTYDDETGEVFYEGGPPALDDDAIANSDECPLFPDADKKSSKFLTAVKVTRLTPPEEGYKGLVPPNVNEDFIARKWGNGTFRLEGLNSKHRVIRNRDVTISVALDAPNGGGNEKTAQEFAFATLQAQQRSNTAEVLRIQALTDKVTDQVTRQGDKYVDMLAGQHKSAMERDREFFGSQNKHMGQFFATMMSQSEQQHSHAVQMMQAGHQQTMQMMQALQVQAAQNNNPTMLLTVLMKGLEMGRDMGSPSDESQMFAGLKMGLEGLGKIKEIASLDAPRAPQVALPRPARVPAARYRAPEQAPEGPPTVQSNPPPNGQKVFSKEELLHLVEFKKLCDAKGIDFDGLVQHAKSEIGGSAPHPPDDDDEFEEDEDEDEDEELDEDEPKAIEQSPKPADKVGGEGDPKPTGADKPPVAVDR